MTLAPGTKLGSYEVLAPLGAGGMGEVWKARDTRLGRDVAIKALPAAFAQDPERLARFEREARLLASLTHPNIAGIHGLEEHGGHRYLVLEYVEGETLAARLARGPLPVDEAIEACRQVAAAVEAAHESGVVHRDLKPGNVMLTPAGTAKVLDFGLARGGGSGAAATATDLSASPTMTYAATAAGVILGTAAYMSPEQARGKAVDRRTDIWSFGCILYECLTGRRTFEGETVSDLIARILERDPDLAALPAGTPDRVRELLARCLVKDARQRLRDIGDARIALDEVLAARTPSGRIPADAGARAGGTGAAGARRGVPIPWLAGGVAIGALAVAAAWLALGRGAGAGGAAAGGDVVTAEIVLPEEIGQAGAGLSVDGRHVIVGGVDVTRSVGGLPLGRLWLRRLDGYRFEPVEALDGLFGGVATPDGRDLIAIMPTSPGATEVQLVRYPLDGSAPAVRIADLEPDWRYASALRGGDLVVMKGDTSFVRIPRAGGAASAPVPLVSGRAGVTRYDLVPGLPPPGGDRAFVNVVSYVNNAYRYSVGLADFATGQVRVLIEDGAWGTYLDPGVLLFARDDLLFAARFDARGGRIEGEPVPVWSGLHRQSGFVPGFFMASTRGDLLYRPGVETGDREFARLEAGGRLTPRFTESRNVRFVELSRDGRRMALGVTNQRGIDEIWIAGADHGDLRRLDTDRHADCGNARWSPDGTRLAYNRRAADAENGIYVQGADGGGGQRVLADGDGAEYRVSDWLPDGSELLLQRTRAGVHDLVLLRLTGGGAGELREIPGGEKGRMLARLSPDGRLVAFWSEETRRDAAFVAELLPDGRFGRRVQLMAVAPIMPRWSGDGRTLYLQDERQRLMAVAVSAGDELRAAAPVEAFDLEKLGIALWAPHPDGSLLVGLRRSGEGDGRVFHLVVNFAGEVRRKLAGER